MAFDEAVTYIAWHRCSSRTQEVLHVRKDNALPKSFLKMSADGTLKEAHIPDAPLAATSDGLRVHFALHRRGVAMDMATLL
eukprot:6468891-Amphidinium_carterae.1